MLGDISSTQVELTLTEPDNVQFNGIGKLQTCTLFLHESRPNLLLQLQSVQKERLPYSNTSYTKACCMASTWEDEDFGTWGRLILSVAYQPKQKWGQHPVRLHNYPKETYRQIIVLYSRYVERVDTIVTMQLSATMKLSAAKNIIDNFISLGGT